MLTCALLHKRMPWRGAAGASPPLPAAAQAVLLLALTRRAPVSLCLPPPILPQLLKARRLLSPGDLVVVVSDVRAEVDGKPDTVRSVQVRHAA